MNSKLTMPGIAGACWKSSLGSQACGRCGKGSIQFDEMVRPDLQYARKWTIWLISKFYYRHLAVALTPERRTYQQAKIVRNTRLSNRR